MIHNHLSLLIFQCNTLIYVQKITTVGEARPSETHLQLYHNKSLELSIFGSNIFYSRHQIYESDLELRSLQLSRNHFKEGKVCSISFLIMLQRFIKQAPSDCYHKLADLMRVENNCTYTQANCYCHNHVNRRARIEEFLR